MSKWWQWSKVEAWNFTIKTFKTCEFNESRFFICRLKSEHSCSRENAGNVHVSWMMHYEQVASKIFKRWNSIVVFPSPYKISGYVLVALLVFTKRSWALFLIWSIWWWIISCSIFYLSKLTKFANATYLDIAPLYTGIRYKLVYHHDGRSQVSIPKCVPNLANSTKRSYYGWMNMGTSSTRKQWGLSPPKFFCKLGPCCNAISFRISLNQLGKCNLCLISGCCPIVHVSSWS